MLNNLREQAGISNPVLVVSVCEMNTSSHHNLSVARVRRPSTMNLPILLMYLLQFDTSSFDHTIQYA